MVIFKKINGYPIIVLTVLVLVAVSVLLLINNLVSPVIAQQNKEKINNILTEMYIDMTSYELENDIYRVLKREEVIGYAFVARGNGYGGEITIMVGLNTNLRIKDVAILSNVETPGIGIRISEKSFADRFEGLKVEDVALSKNGGKVDAITGATISSGAVVTAIRNEMEKKVKALK